MAFSSGQTVEGLTDPQDSAIATELLEHKFPIHMGNKANLGAVNEGVQVSIGDTEIAVDSVLAVLVRRPNIENLASKR